MSEIDVFLPHMRGSSVQLGSRVHALFLVNGKTTKQPAPPAQPVNAGMPQPVNAGIPQPAVNATSATRQTVDDASSAPAPHPWLVRRVRRA